MKVGASTTHPALSLWAAQLAQATQRVAAHRSSPTDTPVTPVGAILPDLAARRPSRQTFDIRV